MAYARWWQRLGAVVIDGLILIPFFLPTIITLALGPSETETCRVGDEFTSCTVPASGTIGVAAVLCVGGVIVHLVRYCRGIDRRGQSWGMGAAGYRIVDERTGEPIGFERAVGRYFARILSALPCYLGFLWPLWDSEHRTFHDMIVGTRAVRC